MHLPKAAHDVIFQGQSEKGKEHAKLVFPNYLMCSSLLVLLSA